ncbi:GTP-binding protein [Citricoccus sp. NPDC079358]|uniref:CobW family GTP-binding protein n=1 Tax=Citricoccus sp. NPDC079358 TaxID=3154653 RepID=UPI00344E97C4
MTTPSTGSPTSDTTVVGDVTRATGRVPVIALTGHLGAGKTSLLNHLLLRPGARLGVVVNDFGQLNVDAAFVTGHVDVAASISGGCLCCLEDAGGLDQALERLAQPKLRLDAILVEASGVADPITVARLIHHSEAARIRPGGVIEVIDAIEHFNTVDTWSDPPSRYQAATLVVIGKTDLLPVEDRERAVARITGRIRERNPVVTVVVARQGRIDPALAFDTAEDEDPSDQLPIAQLMREATHGHGDHAHARSASVALAGPVSPSALIDLLERPPAGAYRIKGRVRVLGPRGEHGYAVNLVGPMVNIAPLPEPPAAGELVAIGMRMDPAAAQRSLDATAAAPAQRSDTAGLRRLARYRRLSG